MDKGKYFSEKEREREVPTREEKNTNTAEREDDAITARSARTRTRAQPRDDVNARKKRVRTPFDRYISHFSRAKLTKPPLISAENLTPAVIREEKSSRIRAQRATRRMEIRPRRSIRARCAHRFARIREEIAFIDERELLEKRRTHCFRVLF